MKTAAIVLFGLGVAVVGAICVALLGMAYLAPRHTEINQTGAYTEAANTTADRPDAVRDIQVASNWQLRGLDDTAVWNVRLTNKSLVWNYSDISYTTACNARSGTIIHRGSGVIYDVLPATSTKDFEDLRDWPIDRQVADCAFAIAGFGNAGNVPATKP